MYEEDDLLPVSALQHLIFCERRAALVHLESLWEENRFTAEGSVLHERVHGAGVESRGDVRVVRGLSLRSLRLGLSGKADVVEFHREGKDVGVNLEREEGKWIPVPIEYKRGQLRHEDGYEIQLCAQAMCLEEMLGVTVPVGAIYYGKTRRRLEVTLTTELRSKTEKAALRLHELIQSGVTPPPVYTPRCERCSLIDQCLPNLPDRKQGVEGYIARVLSAALSEKDG